MKHEAYIYLIQCKSNSKIYIGSSRRVKIRQRDHFRHLRNNKHNNPHLQNAFNKFGIEDFEFAILESCLESERNVLEQKWIDKLQSADNTKGFNIVATVGFVGAFAGSRKESKLKGRKFKRPKSKDKRVGYFLGHSEETKRDLSEAQRHRFLEEGTVVNILNQYSEGCKICNLAKYYKLSHMYVTKIVNRQQIYVKDIAAKHNI